MKRLRQLIRHSSLLALLITPLSFVSAASTAYTPQQTAKLLAWLPKKSSNCSLCPGAFQIPSGINDYRQRMRPWQQLPSKITADGPTKLSATGITQLNKNVIVTQPGRIVKADHATVFRNPKGEVVWIKLHGHVSIREPDRLLVGSSATLNLTQHTAEVNNAAYYLRRYHVITTKYHGAVDGWGTATHIVQLANGVIVLKHATYSTCSPLHPTWQIQASKLSLNKHTDFGHAHNIVLKVKSLPVFYFPYFSFPIGNKRKSGLLFPTIGYSNYRGANAKIPIYWSMAPNFDSTWTFWPMSDRGVLVSSLFRYLSLHTHLELYVGFIPADAGFNNFRREQINKYNPIPANYGPYIRNLAEDSNNRAYISLNEKIHFNESWSAEAFINYVTDDYYFNDFGIDYGQVSANQLFNKVDLRYQGEHWSMLMMAQGYQTLHLIPQINSITSLNQYMRLPEIDAGAFYPQLFAGLNLTLDSSVTDFQYNSSYFPQTFTQAIGWRIHARPGISRPLEFSSGYLTPSVYLDDTSYFAHQPAPAAGQPRPAIDASRNLPIVNIDSGLYLDRHFYFGHHRFIQTLEPRLFYLYVPFANQNKYPNFDGQELPFTYSQLFSLNRFSGYDRLQNANQISLGLSSRVLNANNSDEKLRADLGIIYYFTRPQVVLPGAALPPDHRWSPLIGDLNYSPVSHWTVSGSLAADLEEENINNAGVSVNYSLGHTRSINLGYNFVHTIDGITIGSTNLIHIGAAWPISKRISSLGYLYYDLRRGLPLTYFAGLQYDTCCWALRVIVARSFTGVESNSAGNPLKNLYSTSYYVQLMFKGLGDIGNANPNSLISQAVPGYFNPFK